MKGQGVASGAVGGLVALALVLAAPASAANGRDFAGFFGMGNPIDAGDQVQVVLSFRVFNFSDNDVANATVTLAGSRVPFTAFASFPVPSLPDRESVLLRTGAVLVPREEYENWQAGAFPTVRIAFVDASGNTILRMVELAPGVPEE